MIKQVIILRKDLNMRKGKMVAQGAHASLQATMMASPYLKTPFHEVHFESWFEEWYGKTGNGRMTKICVSCKDKDELFDLYEKAQDANLPRAMIEDAGLTEFKEPTWTAIAIGPAPAEVIDKITGELPLL